MIEKSKHTDTETFEGGMQSSILQQAQAYVLAYFNEKHDNRLTYHNYAYTASVVTILTEIINQSNMPEDVIEITLLSGWFCHCGYLNDYAKPFPQSASIAGNFLKENHYPPKAIEQVANTILNFNSPENQSQKLLSDAVNIANFGNDCIEKAALLRLEKELVLQQKLTSFEWNNQFLQQLRNVKYYNAYCKINYERLLSQNMLDLKNNIESSKLLNKEEETNKQSTKRHARQTSQTFFRTNYANQMHLSAIADNKAHIMISVNSILISVMISLMTYKNLSQTNPMILMPVLIFLVTGLTSLIFAVLSARPKVTTLNKGQSNSEIIKKNVVFFGNFSHLNIEQYEYLMDEMYRKPDLLYGNLTRDIYNLGKVLEKKYAYLTISYNIFMFGFIATVITFLLAFFISV